MVIEPGIEVNPVEDLTPPQTNAGHAQLRQERDADPQVNRRLFLRQTPDDRQRQVRVFHHRSRRPAFARKYGFRYSGSSGSGTSAAGTFMRRL